MSKYRNKLICLVLCIVIIFTVGCSNTESVSNINNDTRTITDCLGREVEIPTQIERVGCIFAISGHVTGMLGHADKIVAMSNGLQKDQLFIDICPEILNGLIVKGGGQFNLEELINSNPDVIFVYTDVTRDHATKKKLDQLGIPYLVVEFQNIEEQKYSVNMIAEVLGEEEKAAKYNKYYDECVNMVSERVKDIPLENRKRVYHAINEVARTDAPNTLSAQWTDIAGAINVSVEDYLNKSEENFKLVNSKCYVNFEQICLWNPDVVIANGAGIDLYFNTKEQFKELKAVKNNEVHLLPYGITRWGHPYSIETPLAIIWTAKTLYPDKFEDIDMQYETKKFYKEFFDYEVTDEEIERILTGNESRGTKN